MILYPVLNLLPLPEAIAATFPEPWKNDTIVWAAICSGAVAAHLNYDTGSKGVDFILSDDFPDCRPYDEKWKKLPPWLQDAMAIGYHEGEKDYCPEYSSTIKLETPDCPYEMEVHVYEKQVRGPEWVAGQHPDMTDVVLKPLCEGGPPFHVAVFYHSDD